MEPKGYVLINKEFKYTTIWPNPQLTMKGVVDLEKEYKEALAGNLVIVMGVSDNYLVLAETKSGGHFIWMIEKGDTMDGSFLPVIKKNGVIMPSGLSPIDEFMWMAKHMTSDTEKYTNF